MAASAGSDLFIHLRILLGTVIGLGMARLLVGFAGFIQHPGRAKLYVTHLIWAGAIFLTLVQFWWWEFALFEVKFWNFGAFLFLIAYCTALFLLSVLLFPDDIKEYHGYEDFFMSRRAWFFGLFAITIIFDLFDNAIKQPNYFSGLDPEYAIALPLGILLCIGAIVTSNRTYHLIVALLQFTYQLSWIVRLFHSPI
ncbi:MAG TPA: hypothetical protein VL418_04625 [Devosiaceae bacterium]|nr:hypothetical protein [Devosiaceae bacterium]